MSAQCKLRPVWENARGGKWGINCRPRPLGRGEGVGDNVEVCSQHPGLRIDVEVAFVRLKPCWSRTSPILSLPTIIPGGFLPFPDGCWKPAWCCCSARSLPRSVISFSRNSSPTYDEVAHLPAGYSYLHWDDYRLNPEHPPLVKKLAALPLLWRTSWPAKVDLQNGEVPTRPETDGESSLRRAWAMSFEDSNAYYDFGRNFLYGTRPGALPHPETNASPVTMPPDPESFYNQADNLVFWGRMPILLLGLGLALLVFLWAREWFGFGGRNIVAGAVLF